MMDIGQSQAHHDNEVAMLLARCARSDADAFRQLYDLESGLLYGVALRITRQPATANDALHDAMLQVWRNAGHFDATRDSGLAWMLSLVRYCAVDALRQVGRETLVSDPPNLLDPQLDPFERLAETHNERMLEHCLGKIEDRPRSLIELAFIEGLTHAQVAARVGMPLGTVKSLIRRALAALRSCMDDAE